MEPDPGSVLDYVVSEIESGTTPTKLAKSVSEDIGVSVHRTTVLRCLTSVYGDEAVKRIAGARADGAHGLAEEALLIIDEAKTERDALTKAKMQADARWQLAERWNRAEFGQPKQAAVQISIGTLHIDALRRQSVVAIAPTTPRAFVTTASEGSGEISTPSAIASAIAEHVEIVSDDEAAT
jgi:hypothetical protein